MPSIMLGRERFALPIGETRVGGTGDGALPFQALRGLPPVAILVVTPGEAVSLWPLDHAAGPVTVNGVPVGAEPVEVTHGTRIDVAGVRLVFRDTRETGATGETLTMARQRPAVVSREVAVAAAPDEIPEAARLTRRGTSSSVDIPESGLVIGRDADSDLVVAGMEVSRRHGVLRRSAEGYVLTDVSRNGTFVNGRRVNRSHGLRVGDVVRIGDEEFEFEAGRATHDAPATLPRLTAQSLPEPPTVVPPAARDLWRRLAKLWGA